MDLAEKHRPSRFEDMEGGDAHGRAVASALASGAHSFLIEGPSGCGKTTAARAIAAMAGASEVHEIDAATFGNIESTRELSRMAGASSLLGGSRVIIFDECHAASRAAWQALLKAVEEPSSGVIWIFCTTEPSKVPSTIRTRCVPLLMRLLDDSELEALLDYVCGEEGIKAGEDVLDVCVRYAKGSARAALQAVSAARDCRTAREAASILDTLAGPREAHDLARLLAGGTTWGKAVKALHGLETDDAEAIRLAVSGYAAGAIRNYRSSEPPMRLLAVLDAFSTPCRRSEGLAPIYIAIGDLLSREG